MRPLKNVEQLPRNSDLARSQVEDLNQSPGARETLANYIGPTRAAPLPEQPMRQSACLRPGQRPQPPQTAVMYVRCRRRSRRRRLLHPRRNVSSSSSAGSIMASTSSESSRRLRRQASFSAFIERRLGNMTPADVREFERLMGFDWEVAR
jgi:hypothetical protein